MPSVTFAYAQQLLQLAATIVAGTEGGAIDRTYISPGIPAIDCETLAVTVTGYQPANTSPQTGLSAGRRAGRGMLLTLTSFVITVARECIPVVGQTALQPPGAMALEAAAMKVIEDVDALWRGIAETFEDGDLFGGLCSIMYLDNAAAIVTQGQTAGWTITLRAETPPPTS